MGLFKLLKVLILMPLTNKDTSIDEQPTKDFFGVAGNHGIWDRSTVWTG
jgi:hypothetical protein